MRVLHARRERYMAEASRRFKRFFGISKRDINSVY
jgi:hypothetical protein